MIFLKPQAAQVSHCCRSATWCWMAIFTEKLSKGKPDLVWNHSWSSTCLWDKILSYRDDHCIAENFNELLMHESHVPCSKKPNSPRSILLNGQKFLDKQMNRAMLSSDTEQVFQTTDYAHSLCKHQSIKPWTPTWQTQQAFCRVQDFDVSPTLDTLKDNVKQNKTRSHSCRRPGTRPRVERSTLNKTQPSKEWEEVAHITCK